MSRAMNSPKKLQFLGNQVLEFALGIDRRATSSRTPLDMTSNAIRFPIIWQSNLRVKVGVAKQIHSTQFGEKEMNSEKQHHPSLKSDSKIVNRPLIQQTVSLFVILLATQITLGATVYNNLDGPGNAGGWWNEDSSTMIAQPFNIGPYDIVTSAEIKFRRIGNPDGTIYLDVYDDNGGVPGERVGNLGTIDPLELRQGDGFHTFDEPVVGLNPDDNYYLVFWHDGRWRDPSPRVFWSLTSRRGANDVDRALAFEPTCRSAWLSITGYPCGGPPFNAYFFANIDAISSAVDFDGDGSLTSADVDLLTAAIREQLPGEQFDLNGDNLVDYDDLVHWIRDQKNTWFGDANLDGEFNSGDFIAVFQEGKFETETSATWSQGDWNADGVFNSTDFIAAFQDGGYENGTRLEASSVPEPSSVLLTLFAMAGLCRFRRDSMGHLMVA